MEMPEDDQPPQEIWLDDEALGAHFEGVRERYRQPDRESVPDPSSPLTQNELTRGLR